MLLKFPAIERKAVGKEKKDYYVLTPVNEKDPLVFAPVDNPFVQKKMRKLLTQEEVHGLIDSMGGKCALWIENENERKERYKSIFSRGDHVELIQMIEAIYAHQKQREASACICAMSISSGMRNSFCTTNFGMCWGLAVKKN